jgi:cleavage stimulation factor subunit 3
VLVILNVVVVVLVLPLPDSVVRLSPRLRFSRLLLLLSQSALPASNLPPIDAPIKRFAQRHTYHSIDAIAEHDLGFARARKLVPSGSLGRLDTPSIPPSSMNVNGNGNGNGGNGNGNGNGPANAALLTIPNPNKRPLPPVDRKRENEHKRPRPDDRVRDDRDRDRRRSPPPSWERDRDVKPQPPPRREPPHREKDVKPVMRPPTLDWFIRLLPPAASFDGAFVLVLLGLADGLS